MSSALMSCSNEVGYYLIVWWQNCPISPIIVTLLESVFIYCSNVCF